MTSDGTRPQRTAGPMMGLLLAMPLGLLPLLLPASSWSFIPLVLALPLHLCGAAWALGHRAEPSLLALVKRRAWISLSLLLLATALLTAVLAWPMSQLLTHGSLSATLIASAAVALGGLAVWRYWPAPLLPLVDPARADGGRTELTQTDLNRAYSTRGARRPLPKSALQQGRALAQSDPSAGRGLLATILLLLLVLGAVGLGLGDDRLPNAWRFVAFPLWSLVLAPFFSFALLALVEPARLASSRSDMPSSVAAPTKPTEPQLLLPAGLDPTMRLYAVARTGRVELALAELDMGADAHALPDPSQRDQRTLAMLAAVLNDVRLLRALIQRGVDLNRRHAGLTPLLAATRDSLRGRPESVMTLLANGADPRATDSEGRTPLHFAALLDDPEVAALLLDANAQIDACNRDGYSPLGVACGAGNWRMARFFLDRKAKPEPAGGQSALIAACSGEDDAAGLQLLIKCKANVNARGRLGRSALMAASLVGNSDIVQALLAAGADVNAADDHAVTALLEAARAGATDVVNRLAEAGPDAQACDSSERNALALACGSANASADTVVALLHLGVDSQRAANDGRRPIDIAIASGRWPLVAALDPGYPLPSSLDSVQRAPIVELAAEDQRPWRERLHFALLDNDVASVDQLLRHACEPDVCAELFDSLGSQLTPTLRQRLAFHIDANGMHADGMSRLSRALDSADGDGIDALIEHGATPGGSAGLARYLRACLRLAKTNAADERRARALLASGADAFASAAGDPPITLSIRLGWLGLLADLLDCGVDPHAADARGESALIIATTRRCLGAMPLLLRAGAKPDMPTADGRTARGAALAQSDKQAVEWLDWSGWRLPGRPLRETDLVAAAAIGDRDAVRRLLMLGLPVDGLDAQGASALLRACGSGHAEVVIELLDNGADAALAATSGATCLSAAVSRHQLDVIAVLLSHGVTADQPLPGDITPLMVAAALGLPEVCRVLLKANADVRATDHRGGTVLHALAQFGFSAREQRRVLNTWDVLLDAGASADARNADGLTPLLLLLGSRMEAGANADEDCLAAQVERLLRAHPDLDARDGRGFGPLHLAALHGQLRSVRRLLSAGAGRAARDSLNRLPHDIAVMRGFVDIAHELTPLAAAGGPSMARLLRDPSQ